MSDHINALGQPIGVPMPNWTAPPRPPREPMSGQYCTIEPIDPDRHARSLFEANANDKTGRLWTYLTVGPFAAFEDYVHWMRTACLSDDPLFHTIVDNATGQAVGVASLMRIDPPNGVIEVGNICFSPLLANTRAATEAMYLLMSRVFELGYRRYEWKCDALNAPSRRAAGRLGFYYEGLFRQAVVYKARNRDTAWFSILDSEWPQLRGAFESWLEAENFDAQARQKQRLSTLTAAARERLSSD